MNAYFQYLENMQYKTTKYIQCKYLKYINLLNYINLLDIGKLQ